MFKFYANVMQNIALNDYSGRLHSIHCISPEIKAKICTAERMAMKSCMSSLFIVYIIEL